ncbi:hypothetical protein LIER_09317 [Lithospermum erythrorhizon]|uniref:Uncharacterized protein n=1 Tax=Lithospermum erythrorhizon TaxID=34254 RepID=A0AAV3PGC6_LITER
MENSVSKVGENSNNHKRGPVEINHQRLGETTKNPIQRVSVFQRLGEVKSRRYGESSYRQKKSCRRALQKPKVPGESEEPQESIASSFLLNMTEEEAQPNRQETLSASKA